MEAEVNPMASKIPGQITRALNRYSNANRELAFIGCKDPSEFYGIETEFQASKEALENTIARAIKNASCSANDGCIKRVVKANG